MTASDSPDLPLISVVLPIFNGADLLDRAVQSVQAQTFPHWELLAVDDASTDGTDKALARYHEDSRIRVWRLPENQGAGAARNFALRQARGSWITYLDHDDEYYSSYLQRVNDERHLADVLVFAYDLVEERAGSPDQGQFTTWDPGLVPDRLNQQHIAVPLGVAHRRDLLDRVGGFNETRTVQEDTDLWRRFAVAEALFLFLPEKSGLYHVRSDSRSRLHSLEIVALSGATQSSKPASPPPSSPAPQSRILFCSYHNYLDPSNGAARCVRDLFELLTPRGWQCAVICGPQLDFEEGKPVEQFLAERRLEVQSGPLTVGWAASATYHVTHAGIPVTIFDAPAAPPLQPPGRAEGESFLALLDGVLDRFRPDLLLTYGGHWFAPSLMLRAKQRGARVVFWLHNLDYKGATLFHPADMVLVPSRFAQEHYRRNLGLESVAIPGPWNWEQLQCGEISGRFVTFVNPQPHKGVFIFARIAEELGRRRPDIPFLVVEGRSKVKWLQQLGVDRNGLGNVFVMANTPDPRQFYRVSRMVLLPSLCNESFPRVPVEAFINGIPVLGSRRGGTPEVLNDAGFLFELPEIYTPETRLVPSVQEVDAWLEKIVQLWDDPAFYERERQRCLVAAEAWRPEKLVGQFEECFRRVLCAGRAE